MTRVLLIYAGPTQWDEEDRLSGNHPLPLTEGARKAIEQVVASIEGPVSAVYRYKKNEACDEVAALVARQFKLKPRDSAALDEMNLGLWQGLTRNELKFRYPKVVEQWKDNPLSVHPPEGESLPEAIERLGTAVKQICRRRKDATIALALRPVAMQIVFGLLQGEDPLAIASHLQRITPLETIELSNDDLQRFTS
jgi:broad specificity phosphatase PhoE